MIRLALFMPLPLALAACASHPVALAPPAAEVRPAIANDRLQGRWDIASVNGRPSNGLWLELGGEGLGTITKTERGIFVGSPQPLTQAHLGCNDLRLNGWTRNGDKLILGIEMSTMTERGCDPATHALETQAHAILRKSMTMEFTPPNRLRLVNEHGSLDLIRQQG
jgi:heat shock protein HslJ